MDRIRHMPDWNSEEAQRRGIETEARLRGQARLWIDITNFLKSVDMNPSDISSEDYPHLSRFLDITGTVLPIYIDKIQSSTPKVKNK